MKLAIAFSLLLTAPAARPSSRRTSLKMVRWTILSAFGGLLLNPAFAQSVFKPEEAADHAGGSVTIEGVASVYTAKSGAVFIDMGGSGKGSTFSAVIFARDVGKFPGAKDWNGKTLDVTGSVQIYQNKPEIILTAPAQVVVK